MDGGTKESSISCGSSSSSYYAPLSKPTKTKPIMKEFIEAYQRNFAPFACYTLLTVLIAWASGVGPFLLLLHTCMGLAMITCVIVTLVERADFECESFIQNIIFILWCIIEFIVILTLFK